MRTSPFLIVEDRIGGAREAKTAGGSYEELTFFAFVSNFALWRGRPQALVRFCVDYRNH